MANAEPVISVVIATLNRRPLLQQVLASLRSQDCRDGAFEVVVVDNGSQDGTWEWLSDRRDAFLCALRELRPGAAAARNRGLAACRGERVIFLDDDMNPSNTLVRAHLDAHERDIGASYLGRIEFPWREDPDPFLRYLANAHAPKLFPFEDGQPVPFQHYYTAHVSTPRKALLSAGGFDESFGGYGHEDTELGYRLHAGGTQMVFLGSATALNMDVPNEADYMKKVRAGGASRLLMIRKHPELGRLFKRARLGARLAPALGLARFFLRPPALLALGRLRGKKTLPPWARWYYDFEARYWRCRGARERRMVDGAW